jgi:hypothetical protein
VPPLADERFSFAAAIDVDGGKFGLADGLLNLYAADSRLGQRTLQIDMQQTVVESGFLYLNSLRQNETALELAGGDSPMQEYPIGIVVNLSTTDGQLVVLDSDGQIIHGKARHREGDPQSVVTDLLDIVRRVSFGGCFRNSVENPLEMIESKKKRAIEHRYAGHDGAVSSM